MIKTYEDFGIHLIGQTGEQVRTTCPSCSSTRKKHKEKCLSVNTEKGVWLCMHCGYSGGLIEKSNSQKYQKPEYKPMPELPETVIEWFKKRCISTDTLKANKIGCGPIWMPNVDKEVNAIQFPFFKNNEIVNIKYRDINKNFRQSKCAEKCFYRFDYIGDPLIITEGEVDALSFLEAGFHKVVSCPDGAPPENAKSYNTKFDFLKSAEEKINNIKKVIIASDNDKPGKILEEELARRIGKEKCWKVEYPEDCKDANDVLVKYGKDVLKQIISDARPYPIEGIYSPEDLKDSVLNLYNNFPERGISTGWSNVDQIYTVKIGELTVVTGIPGSGKSNFIDALMVNIVNSHNWNFAICSPENWPLERHMQTLLEKIISKPFFKSGKYRPRMTQDDIKDAIEFVHNNFSFIMPESESLTVDNILNKAKIAIYRHGIKGLVIDPWNEVEHNYNGMTETQYISKELTKIRRFAKLNGIHVWIVAHPRNLLKDANGTYKPPTMYEISGGANWRNKADNGLCIHRPNMQTDETKVYVQKIRFKDVGRVGETSIYYNYDTGEYKSY